MRSALPPPLPLALALVAGLTSAAGAQPQESKAERAALAAWRALLDVPQREVEQRDLAWVKPTGSGSPKRGSFLAAKVPLARDQLRYLGFGSPRKLPPFDATYRLPSGLAQRSFHVWRYREHYVLTASDGRREQLCVAAIARALELLRARWPRRYQAVLRGPQTAPEQLARLRARDPRKSVSFLNVTRCFAFVLDGGFSAIARSGYELGPKVRVQVGEQSLDLFRNVARVTINLPAIQGVSSHRLYGREEPLGDFLRYLRDGLVETLAHEALHCLLRRDKNVEPLFWLLIERLRSLGGESLGKAVEEAFVVEGATRWLSGGGLSAQVSDYYRGLFLGMHRRRLGLLAGSPPTDSGLAVQAILKRYAERRGARGDDYEVLFRFPIPEE